MSKYISIGIAEEILETLWKVMDTEWSVAKEARKKCEELIEKESISIPDELFGDALELRQEQQKVIECLNEKVKKYELEKSWEESPDRMNGGGW